MLIPSAKWIEIGIAWQLTAAVMTMAATAGRVRLQLSLSGADLLPNRLRGGATQSPDGAEVFAPFTVGGAQPPTITA